MRVVSTLFLLPLLAFLLCAGELHPSLAAAPAKKAGQSAQAGGQSALPSSGQPAGKASAADKPTGKPSAVKQPAAKKPSPLDALVEEFDSLRKDETRSQRRDLWLALEDKFLKLRRQSGDVVAAQAAYYAACARDEIGQRSFLASDRREAVARYEEVARIYSRSPVAPSALYQRAVLLKNPLGDPAAAVPVLERLLKRYPRSPEASKAEKLLAEAKGEAARQTDAPPRKNPGASSVTIKNIFWKGKPQRAVVTLELDGSAPYEYEFVPPNPEKKIPARLYLDIAGASPAQSISPGMIPESLAVTRIRTAQSGDGTRIMFDCDGLRCFAVRSSKKSPQTIQIELSRKMDIKGGIAVNQPDEDGPAAQAGKTDPAGRPKQAGGKTAGKSDALMEQLGLTVQTIMIDAGHGGKDPGAMAGGIAEHTFTLAMAKRVGALLQKKGFTVLYTRTNDTFIPLQDRPDIANHKKADLFISIHINANANPDIHGLEVYYLDMAKNQGAAVVAARENAVSVKNISDLQVILADLMLSSKTEESHELARCVHSGMLDRLRRTKLAAASNGVRSAPFYVLMGARMPSVLVECGYITNSEDARNLRSEAFLQSQAEGLVDGILEYRTRLTRETSR